MIGRKVSDPDELWCSVFVYVCVGGWKGRGSMSFCSASRSRSGCIRPRRLPSYCSQASDVPNEYGENYQVADNLGGVSCPQSPVKARAPRLLDIHDLQRSVYLLGVLGAPGYCVTPQFRVHLLPFSSSLLLHPFPQSHSPPSPSHPLIPSNCDNRNLPRSRDDCLTRRLNSILRIPSHLHLLRDRQPPLHRHLFFFFPDCTCWVHLLHERQAPSGTANT